MFDQTLAWLVEYLPVVLGVVMIAVPAKSENPKSHKRWRRILGCFLILYGGLAWWQIYRSAAQAIKDRDQAVQDTSVRVSKDVTKAVSDAYAPVIAAQQKQIVQLQDQLANQGKQLHGLSNLEKRTAETGQATGLQLAQLSDEQKQQERRDLLLRLSPIIQQLQSALDQWRALDNNERHKYPNGKYDPQYTSEVVAWQEQHATQLKPTMADARYIREQLFYVVPTETQNRIGIVADDSRLGKAADGQPFSMYNLQAIIDDLVHVRRIVSDLSSPPQQ